MVQKCQNNQGNSPSTFAEDLAAVVVVDEYDVRNRAFHLHLEMPVNPFSFLASPAK